MQTDAGPQLILLVFSEIIQILGLRVWKHFHQFHIAATLKMMIHGLVPLSRQWSSSDEAEHPCANLRLGHTQYNQISVLEELNKILFCTTGSRINAQMITPYFIAINAITPLTALKFITRPDLFPECQTYLVNCVLDHFI